MTDKIIFFDFWGVLNQVEAQNKELKDAIDNEKAFLLLSLIYREKAFFCCLAEEEQKMDVATLLAATLYQSENPRFKALAMNFHNEHCQEHYVGYSTKTLAKSSNRKADIINLVLDKEGFSQHVVIDAHDLLGENQVSISHSTGITESDIPKCSEILNRTH